MVIQYVTEESLTFHGLAVTVLISEYVEGEVLGEFVRRQPGRCLPPFAALHLLDAIVRGLEPIHRLSEYHGDLHADNVIVCHHGLGFGLKVLDFIHHDSPKRENIQDDIYDSVKLFYNALGGSRTYKNQPAEVKEICCGLRRAAILKRFPRVSRLRTHLETMKWS